jgi:hypothetical protein
MTFAIGAAIVFLAASAVYLGLIMYDAKHDVENAPRTDMYLCDRHGAFPKKHLMHLSGITDTPIEQCPFCFEDRMKAAKK